MACDASGCLATDPAVPSAVAVDATHVYWGNSQSEIWSVPVAGGAPVMLSLGPANGGVLGLVVDATSVYWTEITLNPVAGWVMKAPLGGGEAVTLAAATWPIGIAVDATSVYWAESEEGLSADVIKKVSLDGGAPTTLAPAAGPNTIAVDATGVYWTQQVSGRPSLNALMQVSLDGGSPTSLAPCPNAVGVAVAGGNAYCAGSDRVIAAPLDGGALLTLATADDGGWSGGLVVDAKNAYWVWDYEGRQNLVTFPLGGGAAKTLAVSLASGQAFPYPLQPNAIAVDSTSLYYVDASNRIMKVTPK